MGIIYNKPTLPNNRPAAFVPAQLEAQLGSGLALPMYLVNEKFAIRSGISKVEQDMWVVLVTPLGRRWNQPDFGSGLHRLLFEDYNPQTRSEMIRYTQEAISTWIPQVKIEQVIVDESQLDQNQVTISIVYLVLGTSAFRQLNVPLTLEEGIKHPPQFFTINGKPMFKN